MAELSGKAIERIKDALLAAFDRAELVQLVRIGLDENLEAIAGAGKLDAVAYDLVLWAERHDRLDDLLAAAQAERPKNAEFAALAVELGGGKAGDAAQAQPGAQLPGLPGGVSIGEIKESNVSFGGTQTITQINTGGGALYRRQRRHRRRRFRRKGPDARTPATRPAAATRSFFKLAASVALHAPPAAVSEAMALVTALQAEAAKGSRCDDARMAELVRALAALAPQAVDAVGAAFGDPAVQGVVGPADAVAMAGLSTGAEPPIVSESAVRRNRRHGECRSCG